MTTVISFPFAFRLYTSPCFFACGRGGGGGGLAIAEGDRLRVLQGPNIFYEESLLVARLRKIKLARVGNTAVSRGNKKPPCLTTSFLFAAKGRSLSTSERRRDLYLLTYAFYNRLSVYSPLTHSIYIH
jgi:hypothetical protein